MTYTAEISRRNPTCFLFVIDQSGSMSDPFGSGEERKKKADTVADWINNWLQNLCVTCAREEGVRDYFHIGVIGYGARVGPAFSGNLAGRDLAPLSEIANSPARVESRTKKVSDGAGGLVDQAVKFPIWFDPKADGGTPMCQGLDEARRVVKEWVDQHPTCFPPVVIHITDGESTERDRDPGASAAAVREVASSDGEALLFNLHLSSVQAAPAMFPANDSGLPDQYARLLFSMSSLLPGHLLAAARREGFPVEEGARGFAFQASLVETIKFLNIGTLPANPLR
jgi:hypothetical protein